VVVIGGGAAGFFGAIACATNNPLARVTILEAGSQPLAIIPEEVRLYEGLLVASSRKIRSNGLSLVELS